MKKPTNIAHPLKNRSGSSQGNRQAEALSWQYAPIDSKTLGDWLYLIGNYAKLVNFYEVQRGPDNKDYQQANNWTDFFENSLPFQLANFSKISLKDLKNRFSTLHQALKENPSPQTLEALLNFIYHEVILPATHLYARVEETGNTFSTNLLAILKSSYQQPLIRFITLYNASITFLCISSKKFEQFLQPPWQLKVKEIYDFDCCIKQVKKGKTAAYLLAGEIASGIFNQFLSSLQEIIEASPNYIQESLVPLEASLQQKHEPHLALLFSFLELFKHVQGNINELGKKHMDFFYKNVLKMAPKNAVPDKAHLIFEIAKHREEGYLLPEGLLLKDGKDANKQDIVFSIDQELIIDKAKIIALRSLSLPRVNDNDDNRYIEGAYIAPVANSLDGKGEKFKEEGSSWATLGDKYSKQFQEGNKLPEEHPQARLGFVLSSPVLLLQEGERKIIITIDCDLPDQDPPLSQVEKDALIDQIGDKLNVPGEDKLYLFNEFLLKECDEDLAEEKKLSEPAKKYIRQLLANQDPYEVKEQELEGFFKATNPVSCETIFTPNDEEQLKDCLDSLEFASQTIEQALFKVLLSGEKEWIDTSPKINIVKNPMVGAVPLADLQFSIEFTLAADVPPVVFYNEENLKEKLDLKDTFPVVKIELNKNIKVSCEAKDTEGEEQEEKKCCLKNDPKTTESLFISPYEVLQKLMLTDAKIEVTVCGLKDLIVQNDENLQDVNKPVMPFGPRPKVDSSFIIGSNEVFCKNWSSFRLNVEWKDRPTNFSNHYEAYNQDPPPNITNNSFDIESSMLEDATWKANGMKKLFTPKETFPPCPAVNAAFNHNAYTWERIDFPINYKEKSMPEFPLPPLNIKSRKGFFRVVLKGNDFQHDRYAFVLAQQMFKLSEVADLIKMPNFLTDIIKSCTKATEAETKTNVIENEAAGGVGSNISQELIDQLSGTFLPTTEGLNQISDELKDLICDLKEQLDDITNGEPPLLPKEPYTPLIKSLSIDYHAIAEMDDMELVHLYPFENTSRFENIEKEPSLLPYFDDGGSLFIGLEEVTPGGMLSLLFQLAEATADSEMNRATINWHYLANNSWKSLLPNFDIISDTTDGLTVSGIVSIAVPSDIEKKGHSIMPNDTYWLKVSVPSNVKAVAQSLGVHTQASIASAQISKLNDKGRLNTALPAGSITKLVNSDFNVKKLKQPYDSFGGRLPEISGHFYVRVSEHLKHKGRGVMITDHEKIVLEAFPEIYKVKCISHSMGLSAIDYRRDLEIAPGYLIIAVIPDLTKLKAGNLLTPKAPISLLEKIGDHLRKKISPFAHLKVMNPRYEPIDVEIEVRLYRGKSSDFYAKKLQEEIGQFLAPWFLGNSEKLAFGQEIFFSDLVGFVEQREYINFILDIQMKGKCGQNGELIKPLTARSILTGGEICVKINDEACSKIDNQLILED